MKNHNSTYHPAPKKSRLSKRARQIVAGIKATKAPTPNTPIQAHTPTPWQLVDDGQAWPHVAAEYIPHGPVCEMPSYDPENEGNGDRARKHALANAAFIVSACNSHSALVALLDESRMMLARAQSWIPANAVDAEAAMTNPVSECRTWDKCIDLIARLDAQCASLEAAGFQFPSTRNV